MVSRLGAILFIFIGTSVAWIILGGTVSTRSTTQDHKLRGAVGQLWGTMQQQPAPLASYESKRKVRTPVRLEKTVVYEDREVTDTGPLPLEASTVDVDLKLDYRRKGLLWYSTYRVKFAGAYRIANRSDTPVDATMKFTFPVKGAVYDDFRFTDDGGNLEQLQVTDGAATATVPLKPGESRTLRVGYTSQGMDEWWYDFGSNVSQVKEFALTMRTDFEQVDFPQNSIAPTSREPAGNGWIARWNYSNLLSGVKIGMAMPHKLNPGPWVSLVSYSAPISLFLFFFLLFVVTTLRKINIHPMNYFFIGCGFFTFHLLLAYLSDHVSIHLAFLISSAVSIFLVVSYMRLVVGRRFAFVEIAVAQFVYLVLFSYTFFFEQYTGLAVTVLCTVTLFIVMQVTGRMNWETVFKSAPGS